MQLTPFPLRDKKKEFVNFLLKQILPFCVRIKFEMKINNRVIQICDVVRKMHSGFSFFFSLCVFALIHCFEIWKCLSKMIFSLVAIDR